MDIGNLIQNIATGGAALLGITYVIGGLIVNLNLARRGLVEYQILKVKYLAVGFIFLFHFSGVLLFTSVPAFLLIPSANNIFLAQVFNLLSVLASLVLFYVWSHYPPNTKSVVSRWTFWFALSVITMIFPILVLMHQTLFPARTLGWIINSILAITTGALAIMAQLYHYSSFYYGRPSGLGSLDPIGIGIPTRVNLLCDEKTSANLKQLGLPIEKNIIQDVYLIDETDQHYILGLEQVPGGEGNNETYKIEKSVVKVILHRPDHMRKLMGNTSKKK
jgi:hypothetical protein